jgi:TPR repeat protein
VPGGKTERFRWATVAAEQGDPFAQLELGYLYSVGSGVSVDSVLALQWYTESANQGFVFSMNEVAQLYFETIVV